jgi:hypothetical protein
VGGREREQEGDHNEEERREDEDRENEKGHIPRVEAYVEKLIICSRRACFDRGVFSCKMFGKMRQDGIGLYVSSFETRERRKAMNE